MPLNEYFYGLAQRAAELAGVPIKAEWIYAQWVHETGNFTSDLCINYHNLDGITQTTPNDTPHPDGSCYYMQFDSYEGYAEYFGRYLRYYAEDGAYNAQNLYDYLAALNLAAILMMTWMPTTLTVSRSVWTISARAHYTLRGDGAGESVDSTIPRSLVDYSGGLGADRLYIFWPRHISQPVTGESQQQAETPAGVEQAADNAQVEMLQAQLDEVAAESARLKNLPPEKVIVAVPAEVPAVIKDKQQKSGADFAIITDPAYPEQQVDLHQVEQLPAGTTVELNQYNIKVYPKALDTYTLILRGTEPTGGELNRSWRIGKSRN